jgi:hypothetical protein
MYSRAPHLDPKNFNFSCFMCFLHNIPGSEMLVGGPLFLVAGVGAEGVCYVCAILGLLCY